MPALTLFTFPPSLDSEFSRFLLRHYGVEHREERHVILFQSIVTLARGRTVRIPLLLGDSIRLNTVRKLIDYFEPRCPEERKLVPRGVDLKQIGEDWKVFHHVLNTATTIFPYYHLLPRREIMVRPLSEGAPRFEVAAVERAYPFFAAVIRALLRLTPSRAATAQATIRRVLGDVDARLADGRRYLNGDRFTLSDMAFAIGAAPAVWPDNYGGSIPALADTPAPVQALVRECRDLASGAFALRIYRDHRDAPPGAA